MTVDPQSFRDALARFATGVTVVTGVMPGGAKVGLTVNAFASLSLVPPMVLACLDRATGCLPAFEEGEHFVVNILAADQAALSTLFAGPANPFENGTVVFREGNAGVPILEGCVATIECRRAQRVDGGDHVILTGHVDRVETAPDRPPLLYYRGRYGDFQTRTD